ncbi:hypothetical protein CL614_06395 [archaeon]|nr:hypothetical protein [archaeon]|tara:strand:- start:4504 stop:4872 length:369 start_codon:yes stop_codon:yes gene_type:complete
MEEFSLDANPDPLYEVKKMQLHEEIATLFTKKRIQIIQTITKKKPKTVGELAKILQRNISAVYRDLKVLENHELIYLEKQGKSVCPKLKNSHLAINLMHSTEETTKDTDQESGDEELSDYIG